MTTVIVGVLLLAGVAWLLAGVRAERADDEADALKAWRERKRKEDAAKRASQHDGHTW